MDEQPNIAFQLSEVINVHQPHSADKNRAN